MKRVVPLLIFVASAAWLWATGNLDGDFRIDEAHKISETYVLRLIERGDFRNPDWLSSPIERSNPVVGKVLFGLAMQLAGVPLPSDMSFAANPDPRGKPTAYRPALLPTRIVSLAATAGTAALACILAGPIASLLFLASFLAAAYGTVAVFDPLLTFFIVGAAAAVADRPSWPRTSIAAVISALAIDTRLSGVLALLGVLSLVRDWRKGAVAAAICLAATIALNPFYWVPGGGSLPHRFAMQIHDLNALLAATGEHRLTALEKMRFVSEYAFGDMVGVATLIGLLLAIRRPVPRSLIWSVVIVVAFTAWLPVGYPRYVLAVIPAFAVGAAIGYRHALVAGISLVRDRRRKAYTRP